MAYNVYETLDNTLRGEPYGQLTPEGQKLWDEYQSLLNAQKGIPMRNMNLRSGAQMQIPDPGMALKNKLLSNTLTRMSMTGLGDRAKPQAGLFAQLAPFLTLAGGAGKNNEILDWIKRIYGPQAVGGGAEGGIDMGSMFDYSPSSSIGENWWSGGDYGADTADSVDWDALASILGG